MKDAVICLGFVIILFLFFFGGGGGEGDKLPRLSLVFQTHTLCKVFFPKYLDT